MAKAAPKKDPNTLADYHFPAVAWLGALGQAYSQRGDFRCIIIIIISTF